MTTPSEANLKAAEALFDKARHQDIPPSVVFALALDAKDAEIARLRAAIAKVPEWECKEYGLGPHDYDVCAFCKQVMWRGHAKDCVWLEINGKKESDDSTG